MYVHPQFGPVLTEEQWVPAPAYLLRRAEILRAIEPLPPGRLLEIGCGAGTLTFEMARRGFRVDAVEISAAARGIAFLVNGNDPAVQLHSQPQAGWDGVFDYLFAFEVLEHIEDDQAALAQWKAWLKPGGLLFLSVPAHARRWAADDEVVGHFRRYERDDLAARLARAGFDVRTMGCYGFPLTSLLRPLRIRKYRGLSLHPTERDVQDGEDGNRMSGVERRAETRLFRFYDNPAGRLAMRVADLLQRVFSRTGLGDGWFVTATARDTGPGAPFPAKG